MLAPLNKDKPSAEWITSIRRKYITEPQIDHVLTRKMKRRGGPGYQPLPLKQLVKGLESLIREQIEENFTICDARWMSGGASKLQVAFILEWHRPGIGFEKTPMVLRMEPAESIVETSRLREFELIKVLGSTVPVPPVFWCDEEGKHLPYPSLIYGFAPGVTKPSNTTSGVSGVGTQLPLDVRRALAPQFVDHLARIHNFDFRAAGLTAFDVPAPGTQCAEWGINWWDRVWEEDGDEEVPLLNLASAWLRRNMPSLVSPSIVHCDYRVGNFLYSENNLQITAWLDWELGRIGDRYQDIAWTTSRGFGGLDENGEFLVCGLMPEADFFAAYEQAANFKIDQKSLHWYRVYCNFSLAILLLGTGYRIARNSKTHQDILVAWLVGRGYLVLDEMREQIEAGC